MIIFVPKALFEMSGSIVTVTFSLTAHQELGAAERNVLLKHAMLSG